MIKQCIKYWKAFWFLLVFFNAVSSVAQKNEIPIIDFNFVTLSNDDPKGDITTIVQDEVGFLWYGTWQGLYRYDGQKAVNLSSLRYEELGRKISKLYIGPKGNIWAGTYSEGLYVINPNTLEIQSFKEISGLRLRNILSISGGSNEEVYIGTNDGLFVYQCNDQKFVHYDALVDEENSEILRVSAVHEDVYGNLWIGSDDGFYLFDNITNKLQRVNKGYGGFVHGIVSDENGNVWVSGIKGSFSFKASKGNWFNIKSNPFGPEPELNEFHYMMISSLNKELIWVGTRTGIFCFNKKTNERTYHPQLILDNQIVKTGIIAIYEDKNGVVWCGTESGFFKYDQHRKKFYSYKGPETLGDIHSLSKINESQILIGSLSEGLQVATINGNGQIISLSGVELPQANSNDIKWNSIYSVLLDNSNNLWISTKGFGTYATSFSEVKKLKTANFRAFTESDNKGLPDNHVMVLTADKYNKVWAGTWNHGLFYFIEKEDRFYPINKSINAELKKFPVSKILFHNNQVYVGTRGNGFFIIDMDATLTKVVSVDHIHTESNTLQIANDFVTDIYVDDMYVYVTTEYGFNRIDVSKQKSDNYFIERPSVPVLQSIFSVKKNDFWISSSQGIYHLIIEDSVNFTYNNYNIYDGLSYNLFNADCSLPVLDGVFFGGSENLCFFKPDDIKATNQESELKIVGFELFNTPVNPGNLYEGDLILNNAIWSTDDISLRYNQNTFSFNFANFNYSAPEKISYAYFLENYDKEWRITNTPEAFYTKVLPGKYILKVKSTNSDGIWREQIASINIKISPPWWLSTPAYLVYLIILSIIFYVVFYFLTYRQRMKVRQLKQQQELEIYDSRMRFYTNISHEFRTPLTLILGFVSRLQDLFREEEKVQSLSEKIDRNAKTLLQLINDIMDLRKLEKDEIRLRKESINPSEFIQTVCEDFIHLYPTKGIELQFLNSLTSSQSIIGDKNRLKSIINNLLSNAYKFSDKNSLVTVEIDAEKKEVEKKTWYKLYKNKKYQDYIVIRVRDQGVGMTREQMKNIFERYYRDSNSYQSGLTNIPGSGIGLSFVKNLVELHNGLIEVNSKKDAGTTFSIFFPLQKSKEEIIISNENETIIINEQKLNIEEEVEESTQKNQNIILVIDDHQEVRDLLREILGDYFKVIEAVDGEDGLQKANDTIPDLIISDVMMPGIDGYELTEKLKSDEFTSHIPVILLTALPTTEDRIKGLKQGADSYIPKPFDPEHLMVRIEKLIEIRSKLKEKHYKEFVVVPKSNGLEEADPNTQFINKLKEIIEENLHNSDYDISNICEELGISRMQLYRKLKATVGYSANELIRKIRLHKASQLLLIKDARVSQVTYDVGFNDIKYFRKCFTEEFGLTPSAYIKENLEKKD